MNRILICIKSLDKLQIFLYIFVVKVVKGQIMICSLGPYTAKPALFDSYTEPYNEKDLAADPKGWPASVNELSFLEHVFGV